MTHLVQTNILGESRKSVQRSCLSPCGHIKGEEKTFVGRIVLYINLRFVHACIYSLNELEEDELPLRL